MATVNVLAQLQQQTWQKKMQKQLVARSVWEQLSNRTEQSQSIPNGKNMKSMPKAVVINVSDAFDKGTKQTTVPFLGKLQTKGVGGRQKAEGNEETPSMKFKSVHYNNQRKPIALEDESVDSDLAKFYSIGNQGTPLLTDYFVELTDYNMHRAALEGGDEYLTEAEYWTGDAISTPPVSKAYCPNWYANGAAAKVTYDSTYATYETAIQTAVNALTTASNSFDLRALDSMVFIASRTLMPIGWSFGGEEVDWVFLITPIQARELQSNLDANGWQSLIKTADPREDGEGKNRAISGKLGVYRRCLIVVNERAPLWNTAGSTGAYIQYIKPWADDRVPVAKTAADTGTVELALAFGRGALGCAKIKSLRFDEQWKDYNFNKGVCGMRAEGVERMDFDISTPTDTSVLNQTMFVYSTATPSTVY
jgi:hypothetical protein